MSNKLEQLRAARDRIEPEWGEPQIERGLVRLHGRLRTQRIRQRAMAGLAIAAGMCAAVGGGVRYGRHAAMRDAPLAASAVVAAPAVEEDVLRYPDGSGAFSVAPGTRLQLELATSDRVVTSLERGAARFEVVPDHEREFRVRVEGVTITDLGTIFTVVRGEQSVHVAVQRGRVNVDAPGATAILEAGEEGDYPLAKGAATGVVPSTPQPPSVVAPPAAAVESWRALARRGRHHDAYALMHGLRPQQVGDAEELLAAADVARLSGHPREAVPFLERVLSDFRGDSRAPLAAFALGRILLPSQPESAAARFEEARALAPTGALAEDALAREVEAWSRAGAHSKAHDVAAEYVRRYPQGSRVDQVREMGGL